MNVFLERRGSGEPYIIDRCVTMNFYCRNLQGAVGCGFVGKQMMFKNLIIKVK